MLQNSKEEALNNAFKGDDSAGENNIVQELTKEIISEVQRMTGNDVCCDCGAPGDPGPPCHARGPRLWLSPSFQTEGPGRLGPAPWVGAGCLPPGSQDRHRHRVKGGLVELKRVPCSLRKENGSTEGG